MSRETVLRQYIDSLRNDYDYILLDCNPSLGMLVINSLAAADATEDDLDNPDIIVCNTTAELMSALAEAVNSDFDAGMDKPKVTINADMVLLKDTTLYQDYAPKV